VTLSVGFQVQLGGGTGVSAVRLFQKTSAGRRCHGQPAEAISNSVFDERPPPLQSGMIRSYDAGRSAVSFDEGMNL
jgi:hypothetical protein